jgi:hypothetical protein
MVRKALFCALAAATMVSASAALAGPGGGHGGNGGGMGNAGGLGGTMGNAGGMAGGMGNAGAMGNAGGMGIGTLTRDDARINSQGAANASATGIAHANSNSVLAGTSGMTTLTGVTTGMPVLQNGIEVGTVQRVITNNHGVVVRVIVRGMNGQTFSLSPTSLALSGTTLTTTAMLRTR